MRITNSTLGKYRMALQATSALALLGAPLPAFAQDEGGASASHDEPIVVTGSRIVRSSAVPPASPIDVLGADRLDAQSSNTVATFLKDLPANFGGTFQSGRGLGDGNEGQGTVDLRGLGPSATLVLIDGQRVTQVPNAPDYIVDINSLVPQIMIKRVEVVKDGASAIYGSDAVAGVVNFITNDNFKGLVVDGRWNDYTFSNKGDRRVEAMLGSDLSSRGHVTIAASYSNQDAMFLTQDLPIIAGEGYDARNSSATSWPGIFTVPVRDASGHLTNQRRSFADPLCGQVLGSFPSDGTSTNGVANQLPNATNAKQCRFYYYPDGSAQSAIDQFQVYLTAKYDLTDGLTLNLSSGYTKNKVLTYYASGATASIPNLIVPGNNPGALVRATDANGHPLYAVSSGVSAGFSRDGATVFLPQRDASGNVILAPNPTDPSSGIPFYEDASYTGRAIGSQGGLPTNNEWAQPGYSLSRPSETDSDIFHATAGLTGELGGNWVANATVDYSYYNMATNGEVGVALQKEMRAALQGLGGVNCSGNTPGQNGCEYYNIAGSNVFATAAGDPKANSQDIIDYIFPLLLDRYTSSLLTAEGLITGSPITLPAGNLGVAFGAQIRKNDLRVDYDTNKNNRNTASNTINFDFDKSRTTKAVFAELIAPVFDNSLGYLELSGAVRHEWAPGLKTTNPKVGILFNSHGGFLTLRGTYGTSFVAPSLFRLYAQSGATSSLNDVCSNPACTGNLNQVITLQTSGNPDLKPERARTFNFGATIKPFSNLQLSADWWRYDYTDRIVTQAAQDVLLADPSGELTGHVVRGANGQVVQVTVEYFNAPAVITQGWDFAVNYDQDLGSLGSLRAALSASYVPTYKARLTPNGEFVNYAGLDNFGRAVVPQGIPKWRGNLFFNWIVGKHNLAATVNYIDGLTMNQGGYRSPTLNPDYHIPAWTTLDLSYSYDLSGMASFLKGAKISVGATNVFDAKVPSMPVPASQEFNGNLYELRGRMVWVNLRFEL